MINTAWPRRGMRRRGRDGWGDLTGRLRAVDATEGYTDSDRRLEVTYTARPKSPHNNQSGCTIIIIA